MRRSRSEIEAEVRSEVDRVARSRGLTRQAAAAEVFRARPELHRRLMAAANPGDSLHGAHFSDGERLDGDVYRHLVGP